MPNILLATLGESPIVVTAMYQLLTEQEQKHIDKVIVLCPQGELVQYGYELIEDVLKDRCEIEQEQLPLDDVNGEAESYTFLRMLYHLLSGLQNEGHVVYLSLAGGRKNMSALMAVLVPLFPCVQGLYHVIDRDEQSHERPTFRSIENLYNVSDSARHRFFSPSLDRLILVDIPYGEYQQVSQAFRDQLYGITEEGLEILWEQNPVEAQTTETYRRIVKNTGFLEIFLTKRIRDEYIQMLKGNVFRARHFSICFEQMKDPYRLQGKIHGSFSRDTFSFHFYKRPATAERPFYHTEPQGIHFFPKANVERVIISGLAIEQPDGSYRPSADQLLQAFDSEERTFPLDDVVPPIAELEKKNFHETVLVVPLGATPMVATQLCALLQSQGRTIKEVALVYPQHPTIQQGADMLQEAFQDEKIDCTPVVVKGRKDIDSREACLDFEQTLSDTIDAVRKKHPDCQLELALSGGRKGMAALSMFVAQRKNIHYVYHTLINDEQLSERVERETKLAELSGTRISKQIRNDRFFLRAYEGNGPYTKFVLFKVPVLPARG